MIVIEQLVVLPYNEIIISIFRPIEPGGVTCLWIIRGKNVSLLIFHMPV